MTPEGEQGFWVRVRNNWPLAFATILTFAFLTWTSWVFLRADCGLVNCESRLDQFLSSTNNEMGDTLAGFVGSLTLIWVVASVLQQSMELRAQRREFSEMARAQSAQVKALEAQAAIFEDEKRRRDQSEAKSLYEQYLIDIGRIIQILAGSDLEWYFPDQKDTNSKKVGSLHYIFGSRGYNVQTEENVNGFHRTLRDGYFRLKKELETNKKCNRPVRPKVMSLLIRKLEQVCEMEPRLAEPEIEKLRRMTAKELVALLKAVESDTEIWAESAEQISP